MKGLVLVSLIVLVGLTYSTHSAVVKRGAVLEDDEIDDGDNTDDKESYLLAKRWLEPSSSYGGAEPSYIKRAIGGGQEQDETGFPAFPVNDVGEFEGEAVPNNDPPKEEEEKFEDVKDNEIEVEEKVPKVKVEEEDTTKGYYYKKDEVSSPTTHKPWHKKAWHYLRDNLFRFRDRRQDSEDYTDDNLY